MIRRMEATQIIDAASADLLVGIGWYAVSVIVTGAVSVIGTLLWGRGGRKRLVKDNKSLKERMAALEAKIEAGPQVMNIAVAEGGMDPQDIRQAIRAESTAAEQIGRLTATVEWIAPKAHRRWD